MKRAFAILAFLFCAGSAPGAPVWRNIGPGGGGWVPCVVVSPFDSRVVFAGCDVGGFYRSSDAGATWHICNTGLHDYAVEVIAPHPRDPAILYIGTQAGVHKSVDGGHTWSWQRSGFPPPDRYRYVSPWPPSRPACFCARISARRANTLRIGGFDEESNVNRRA